MKGPEYWLGLELSLTAAFWNSYNLEQYGGLVAHLRLPSFRREHISDPLLLLELFSTELWKLAQAPHLTRTMWTIPIRYNRMLTSSAFWNRVGDQDPLSDYVDTKGKPCLWGRCNNILVNLNWNFLLSWEVVKTFSHYTTIANTNSKYWYF